MKILGIAARYSPGDAEIVENPERLTNAGRAWLRSFPVSQLPTWFGTPRSLLVKCFAILGHHLCSLRESRCANFMGDRRAAWRFRACTIYETIGQRKDQLWKKRGDRCLRDTLRGGSNGESRPSRSDPILYHMRLFERQSCSPLPRT